MDSEQTLRRPILRHYIIPRRYVKFNRKTRPPQRKRGSAGENRVPAAETGAQEVLFSAGQGRVLPRRELLYPDRVSANIYYANEMSHKLYASCDAFLMPSLFEPCGLSQLMSLRYGTVPIVRETGGLKDTVVPYNEYESTGTGFSFANYNAHEMLNTIRYAKHVFQNKKREWNKMIDRCMQADFSWETSARKYEALYRNLLGE